MRPTVLLFDIDGTLISTGGAGRRAIERAFERRAGRRDTCAFPFGGMTDRAIVRAGFDALGSACTDADIDAVLDVYLELLAEELTASPDCLVHDGIEAALDVAAAAGFAVGLGTGNI